MLSTPQLVSLQIPKGTPNPGESIPIDLSNPFEVIVFIIFPILMIVVYLMWRKKKKNNHK